MEAVAELAGCGTHLRRGISGVLHCGWHGGGRRQADSGGRMHRRPVACGLSAGTDGALRRSDGNCLGYGPGTTATDDHECGRACLAPSPCGPAAAPGPEFEERCNAATAVCTGDRGRQHTNVLLPVSIEVQLDRSEERREGKSVDRG